MGSPSSTMGMETKLLLGLAFLGLVLASPLPQPQPQPVVDPFGLIGRIFGLQGSGTLNSFKPEKPKPFKPEECICERTFHKKPDKKKKKKPEDPCDCYGAPESGYGVPSKPPLTSYTSPCNPYQHVGRRRRSANPNHTKSFDFFGDGGIFSPKLAADFHTLRKKKKEKKNPCF